MAATEEREYVRDDQGMFSEAGTTEKKSKPARKGKRKKLTAEEKAAVKKQKDAAKAEKAAAREKTKAERAKARSKAKAEFRIDQARVAFWSAVVRTRRLGLGSGCS